MNNRFKYCGFLLLSFIGLNSCNSQKANQYVANHQIINKEVHLVENDVVIPAANRVDVYLPLLKNKKVGLLTNQTGVVEINQSEQIHLVDFLLSRNVDLQKIYAPEHGFRGTADAGEWIKDGKDAQTGLPIISLYANNKKPTKEHLEGIDIMVFDLQDVGVRFYTYISSLHYLMEACAEQNIPLVILDRPNPNIQIVDGPVLDVDLQSFVGMHPVPILHGMTIAEYAQMINGEKWLKDGVQCKLQIVTCDNYSRSSIYNIPIPPSPNLPNEQSINLYASLCFFEGTNVSVGRGTDMQFQIFGSPFLENMDFKFTPKPNQGAKNPMYNGKECKGRNLVKHPKVNKLELKWLIDAYQNTSDKSKFFNNFFDKLSGNKTLRKQIEQGMSQEEIRKTWQTDLEDFKKRRVKYLLYK
ncbi:MAG: DUF1343 domain-containing protein [Bacteroidota bacterium]|nr:DUF1343 domain-containing protein [Bacteroidota bacterium]